MRSSVLVSVWTVALLALSAWLTLPAQAQGGAGAVRESESESESEGEGASESESDAAAPGPVSGTDWIPLLSLRFAPGAAGYLAPSGGFHFDMDATAGFRLAAVLDQLLVAPLIEAGYTVHEGSAERGRGDFFIVGGGFSVGTPAIAATFVPAYVVGVSEGDTVHGVRAAARADFWLGIWSIELAHEWRAVRGTDVHALRFTVTLDLGIILSWALNWFRGSSLPAQDRTERGPARSAFPAPHPDLHHAI